MGWPTIDKVETQTLLIESITQPTPQVKIRKIASICNFKKKKKKKKNVRL